MLLDLLRFLDNIGDILLFFVVFSENFGADRDALGYCAGGHGLHDGQITHVFFSLVIA